jgi:hypothetical protein
VPTLTVVLNSQMINETDSNPASYGTVTRNTPTTSALTVSLLSNEINKLTVPATIRLTAMRRRPSPPPPAVSSPVPTAPWWSTTTSRRSA